MLWAWLSVTSAGILAGAGLLLAMRPKPISRGLVAAVLLLWALHTGLAAAHALARSSPQPPPLASTLHPALASLFLVPVPVVLFAATYGNQGSATIARPWALLLLMPSAVGLFALNANPGVVYALDATGGMVWGPVALLNFAGFMAAFAYATLVLLRWQAHVTARIEVRRANVLVVVLAVFLSYKGVELMTYYLPRAWGGTAGVGAWVFGAIGLLALGTVGVAAATLLPVSRLGARAPKRWLIVSILVPGTVGLYTGSVGLPSLLPTPMDNLGIWQTAAGVVFAADVLRYQPDGLPPGKRRTAAAAIGALIIGLAALAVDQIAIAPLGMSAPSRIALGLVSAGFVGAVAMGSGAVDRLLRPSAGQPERAQLRAIEVYEAEVARAAEGNRLDLDAAHLAALRQELGITEHEHELLLRLVSQPHAVGEHLRAGGMVGDRYRIDRFLAEGGEGTTFVALDIQLDRAVVLKALTPYQALDQHAVHRFLREARIAAQLDHPNIIRVYDFGFHADRPYLILEYATGGSLADHLQRGPLSSQEVRRILLDVLEGLHRIHERRILHRDIKPANVLFQDGRAKIADFGIAQAIDGSAAGALAEVDTPRGTPAYMSPESARGVPLLPQSDLYAVGAVLYEMLAGRPYLAFGDMRSGEILRAITEQTPDPLPAGVDPTLARVALRALEKNPKERFGSAAEMIGALRDLWLLEAR